MVGRVSLLLVVAATSACNFVFDIEPTELAPVVGGGTDLDLDGIPDDKDPCIAAMMDDTEDYDRDDITNATDPCPFDDARSLGGNPDSDGDGVNDACDPFPQVAGDSRACTMRFYNTDLNARLWHEADAMPSWTSTPGALYANEETTASNLVATIDLERTSEPTYDVALYTSGDPYSTHGVRVWSRAAEMASPNDLGCEVYGDRTYTRIAIALGDGRDLGTAKNLVGTPFPLAAQLRIQLTVVPATGTVRCTVSRFPDKWTVSAQTTLPMGRFGFGSEGVQTQISGVAFYDRSTVVPL